jgi:hypothetical protein
MTKPGKSQQWTMVGLVLRRHLARKCSQEVACGCSWWLYKVINRKVERKVLTVGQTGVVLSS